MFMVTSGGYQRQTARVVADSILNLRQVGLISHGEPQEAPLIEPAGQWKPLIKDSPTSGFLIGSTFDLTLSKVMVFDSTSNQFVIA